jgi:succinate-semialdehyde dehydrogenase/glutarate-semialdehyde dehydrogenase
MSGNAQWVKPYGAIAQASKISLLIDGKAVDTATAFAVVNPATGLEIANASMAEASHIAAALESSQRAFRSWRNTPALARAEILNRAAGIIRNNAEDIALTMTLEQGKPLAQSMGEVLICAETYEWYASEGLRAYGRILPARTLGGRQMVLPEPIGPVAAFTAWNFPGALVARKIAPALAAGCACILKPAEETPATALALAWALVEAGLPDGVLNVIFGDPAQISETLISSDVIRKVTFTGSVNIGKRLAVLAAQAMKPCTLELGGHAPVIVMDDADPALAAKISAQGKSRNSGQVCTSPTRFYVQDAVHDEFLGRFSEALQALKVGDGAAEGTEMGPLANDRRVTAMEALVADAVSRGARIVTGGKRIGNVGYFFEPTLLADVPDDAEIMSTEPFGPVAIVQRFVDIQEALSNANRNRVGLAGYAFTESHPRAVTISAGMEVGVLGINSFAVSHTEAPFGGVKDSGYGYEGGAEGLAAYLHQKYVHHA